ncbi:MAG: glycosyltransferase family 4 protein [Halioglobus sp.]
MIATSYPRNDADWQGLFIRRLAAAMGREPSLTASLWAPEGPLDEGVSYSCTSEDAEFLRGMAERGGIAYLLKSTPFRGLLMAIKLLLRLRKLYRRAAPETDIFHINWLQNALPLYRMNVKAVIAVLGTDFQLLKIPGVVFLIRRVLATNQCILAPNSDWMVEELRRKFGDLAEVRPVNFGIENIWYEIPASPPKPVNEWLCVLRLTPAKVGRLFAWGETIFGEEHVLNLVGPNQAGVDIPEWANYLGPLSPEELSRDWYPRSTGFVTLSEHDEGKPQVLLETMAAGLPVIASNIPAHAEVVQEGFNGYLVASKEAFASAIENMSNPEHRSEMSLNCRNSSKALYGTWADCLNRYLELYRVL